VHTVLTVLQLTVLSVKPAVEPANGTDWFTSIVAGGAVEIVTCTTCRVKVVVWVTGTVAPSVPETVMVYMFGAALVVVSVRVELGVPGTLTVFELNEQATPVGSDAVGHDSVIVPV
jgi:hypothetical protein